MLFMCVRLLIITFVLLTCNNMSNATDNITATNALQTTKNSNNTTTIQNSEPAHEIGVREIYDDPPPLSLDKIKVKLKESGIFDWQDEKLTEREKKEMNKLFDTVEIMMTSRARQPSNVQGVFSSMRLIERVVNKQLKQGQISESLALKFHWDKIGNRQRRANQQPYYLDKDNMRVFYLL